MRDQAAINAKISQKAIERRDAGTLKMPPSFKKGFDPKRKVFNSEDAKHMLKVKSDKFWLITEQKLQNDEVVSYDVLRKYLSRIKKTCGHKIWNAKPLVLKMHHLDGDNKNNRLSNVELQCPNCHSQTFNFRKKKSSLNPAVEIAV